MPIRWRGAPALVIPGKASAGTRAAARAAPTGACGGLVHGGPRASRPTFFEETGDGPPGSAAPTVENRKSLVGVAHEAARADWQRALGQFKNAQTLWRLVCTGCKRNYSQVLPGDMPRGGSRSCSGADRYELQRLSGFACPENRTAARSFPGVQGAAGRALKRPVPSPGPSFRPLSSRRKGTRRRHGHSKSRTPAPDVRLLPKERGYNEMKRNCLLQGL